MSNVKDLFIRYLKYQQTFFEKELTQRILHRRLEVPANQLYDQVHAESMPVFVLSTGRCGTRLLSNIIGLDPQYIIAHQPSPELSYMAGYVYHESKSKSNNSKMIADACRYETIRDAWLTKKTYVETNNRITFFAPQLAEIYPQSKFIHLQRDVLDFVTSGYSRNWYTYEKIYDEGRITPHPLDNIPWEEFSQVQKITWLWIETNRFIRNFMLNVSADRKFHISSSDLYTDQYKVHELLQFVGTSNISMSKIKRTQSIPVNVQPKSRKKVLSKEQIVEITSIVEKYGKERIDSQS
jgi:hypothetical protein